MPDKILSYSPWWRIYVGQTRQRDGSCLECWYAYIIGEGAIYHQPEGGVRSGMDINWTHEIIEASIPPRLLQGGIDIQHNAMQLVYELFVPYAPRGIPKVSSEAGNLLKKQHDHVQNMKQNAKEARKIYDKVDEQLQTPMKRTHEPDIALPARYTDFTPGETTTFPESSDEDMQSDDDDVNEAVMQDLERTWFEFKGAYKGGDEGILIMTEILQQRFSTERLPPSGVVYNLRFFGEVHDTEDPRKVFEFFEWVEWLTEDRSICKCQRVDSGQRHT
jgi:hypothetical protein